MRQRALAEAQGAANKDAGRGARGCGKGRKGEICLVVLHSDLNNFYATVEKKLFPELAGKPVAVCGDKEARHGVVLAKSEEAKAFGVKTGDVIWEAQRKCPNLIIRPVRFSEYVKQSRAVRGIYARYTDLIEPFGIDECWLDVTHSTIFGSGEEIAERIRREVKEELSLTVSVGVSFNKVFAKLASDLKKPDAVTVVSRENYREKLYPLPASNLLYVGKATAERLRRMGISTIGELAAADPKMLANLLGKWGAMLSRYARGEDNAPVRNMNDKQPLKSVGNSMTYFEDIYRTEDVKRLLYVLAESVAARMKDAHLGKADTVHLWVRDKELQSYSWQKKVRPTALVGEIAEHAFALFKERYKARRAVRGLGVTVSGFDLGVEQLSFDSFGGDYEKKARAEEAVGKIREKYGYSTVQRGIMFEDRAALKMDVRGERLVRPGGVDGDIADPFEEEIHEIPPQDGEEQ